MWLRKLWKYSHLLPKKQYHKNTKAQWGNTVYRMWIHGSRTCTNMAILLYEINSVEASQQNRLIAHRLMESWIPKGWWSYLRRCDRRFRVHVSSNARHENKHSMPSYRIVLSTKYAHPHSPWKFRCYNNGVLLRIGRWHQVLKVCCYNDIITTVASDNIRKERKELQYLV